MKGVLIVGAIDEQHTLTAQVPEWMLPGVVSILLIIPDDRGSDDVDWSAFHGTECTVELEEASNGYVRIRLDPGASSTDR